jgi:hypothetical protein
VGAAAHAPGRTRGAARAHGAVVRISHDTLILLVGCTCVATAYNNTYVNYPPKKFKIFY